MKKQKTKVEDEKVMEKELLNDKEEQITEPEEVNIEKISEMKKAKKKVPKEISQEILKKIFKNLILAVVVMIYFIAANILYTKIPLEEMIMVTEIISGVFLLSGIIILEVAYKKESGTLTFTAIELFVLSMHALFINHIITIYHFDFRAYLLTSSYIFAIYYVLKSIIIYTKGKKRYFVNDMKEMINIEE